MRNTIGVISRSKEYDFIKGMAIICVVLLHSIANSELHRIYAPWHIWQAIPLFVMVSGVLHAQKVEKEVEYSLGRLSNSLMKLIKPALLLWTIQVIAIYLVKDDVNSGRIYELVKQGGFGAGGYFIYIAIQNLFLGVIYYWVINRWRRKGLALIALFSIAIDFTSYSFGMDEELYRVLATRYAFFFALGLAHVKGVLDFSVGLKLVFWAFGFIWLVIVKFCLSDSISLYTTWQTHTALSGFFAYGYFILLIYLYKIFQDFFFTKFICMLGERSYYIFLSQLMFFWIKRWADTQGLYLSTGYLTSLVDLGACLLLGSLYSKIFEFKWIYAKKIK